jgi:tRNA A37 methylthiotransferase MiaB
MARKSNKTVYETVSKNIQKITTPTGNINYRVRVGFGGETLSQYASSLKEAKAVRNQLMA